MVCGTVSLADGTWQIVAAMDISKEALEAIQKTVDEYPDAWTRDKAGGYVAAYTLHHRATGAAFNAGNKAGAGCHYAFSNINDNTIAVNGHKPIYHGQFPDLVKWVCRESPFSHGVLNKDNEKEILNHASVLDGEAIGKGGCLWIAKALRYTVEDKFRAPIWCQLREAGLDGLGALIGCSIVDSLGNRHCGTTHNSLFGYGSPSNMRQIYDEIRNTRKIETTSAARPGDYTQLNWGDLQGKKVNKSDGWGGFTQVTVPSDPKEFAASLKEIFKGDPNNVK